MLALLRQRPKVVLAALLAPVVVVTLMLSHSQGLSLLPYRGKDVSKYEPGGYEWNDEEILNLDAKPKKLTEPSNSIPAADVEQLMTGYLQGVWDKFDSAKHFESYGLRLGNVELDKYYAELQDFYSRYFTRDGSQDPEWYDVALSRLSLRPPKKAYPPSTDQVVTTDKDINKLPDMFSDWQKQMPDAKEIAFDDRGLERWVEDNFAGTEFHNIWKRLPRIVLKSDIFRYLIMLVEGGIYADSDTSPLIPADKWGQPYEVKTPELLRSMTEVLGLIYHPDAGGINHPAIDGNENGPPALVVGIEFDCIMYGWNWRDIGVSRAVQITQWVMMARPGHPVFLDVVGRALDKTLKIEKEKAEAKAKGEKYTEEWALEWTGPGVWTDCVYRYLISRYGFSPEDLIRQDKPIRVGDVLILPSKTFAAQWPDEHGKFGKAFDAVVHGFNGRWRHDDPTVQEINRIKEEKQKEEEAKKKAEEEAKKKEAEDNKAALEAAWKAALEAAEKE